MTREDIVTFFGRRHEAYERHDPVALAALHSPDCVLESAMAGTVVGRQGVEQFYDHLFASFPDFKVRA